MFKKSLITAACLVATMTFPVFSFAQEQQNAVQVQQQAQKLPLEGTVLNIVLSVAPPFVNLEHSLTHPDGLEVDIIKELQRRTGFIIANNKIGVMNFSEMMDMGMQKKADILAASISYNAERAKHFDVSHKYLTSSVSLVARKGSGIRTSQDLSYKTIAYPTGTNMEDLISQFPGATGYEASSLFMAIFAVSRGMADALFIDTPIAFDYTHNWTNGNLEIVEELANSSSEVCLLFKKDAPHNAHLHAAFEEMTRDGTLDKIINKYLGKDNSEDQFANNL